MATRYINFNPGPSMLPLPVLEHAQRELLDLEGSGMSILEHSHRGAAYGKVHQEAISLLTELLAIPDSHQVLFMCGGATLQFALVPMNLGRKGRCGDYVITGVFADKACREARAIGEPRVAWNESAQGRFTRVPEQRELQLSSDAPYVHYTSNNTIMGTQFRYVPQTGAAPLVADMTSDILSHPIDVSRFGLIYAGAQKNMGCAGVTAVIVRKDLLERAPNPLPTLLSYAACAQHNSLQNTIPTFGVYMTRNVLRWVQEQGGVQAMERSNRRKAELLYAALDESDGYYSGPAERESRSMMNVVYALRDAALDAKFVEEARAAGLVGLKGHRLVGGIRASIYNAMPLEGVQRLAEFMREFRRRHP